MYSRGRGEIFAGIHLHKNFPTTKLQLITSDTCGHEEILAIELYLHGYHIDEDIWGGNYLVCEKIYCEQGTLDY